MTNTKSPSERIVMGRVSMMSKGRKKAFIIPKITAKTRATKNPSTCTPGKTYALINIARDETIQCIIVFIIYSLYHSLK